MLYSCKQSDVRTAQDTKGIQTMNAERAALDAQIKWKNRLGDLGAEIEALRIAGFNAECEIEQEDEGDDVNLRLLDASIAQQRDAVDAQIALDALRDALRRLRVI
jgi:hypothetical protein